jgi:hypothetical protein
MFVVQVHGMCEKQVVWVENLSCEGPLNGMEAGKCFRRIQ